MSKKSDCMYNLNLNHDASNSRSITQSLHRSQDSSSAFVIRNSSTGGKVPHYGPRRVVIPNQIYAGQFENDRPRFHCNQSEIQNYQAICRLAD
jgi:hypothetical protein